MDCSKLAFCSVIIPATRDLSLLYILHSKHDQAAKKTAGFSFCIDCRQKDKELKTQLGVDERIPLRSSLDSAEC